MIKFYLNRELSKRLGINLSRWKRWSREFLPPDPLGGLQSGYARQFNLGEAFRVYLGGYLVADLKFSIPDAGMILDDLKEWISTHCFFHESNNHSRGAKTTDFLGKNVSIHIFWKDRLPTDNQNRFAYIIQGMLSDHSILENGMRIRESRYIEERIGVFDGNSGSDTQTERPNWTQSRSLYITEVYHQFLSKLNIDHTSTKLT